MGCIENNKCTSKQICNADSNRCKKAESADPKNIKIFKGKKYHVSTADGKKRFASLKKVTPGKKKGPSPKQAKSKKVTPKKKQGPSPKQAKSKKVTPGKKKAVPRKQSAPKKVTIKRCEDGKVLNYGTGNCVTNPPKGYKKVVVAGRDVYAKKPCDVASLKEEAKRREAGGSSASKSASKSPLAAKKERLRGFTVKELKAKAKKRGIVVKGKKAEIVNTLAKEYSSSKSPSKKSASKSKSSSKSPLAAKKERLRGFTVKELKAKAKKRGIVVKGKKAEIVNTLAKEYSSSKSPSKSKTPSRSLPKTPQRSLPKTPSASPNSPLRSTLPLPKTPRRSLPKTPSARPNRPLRSALPLPKTPSKSSSFVEEALSRAPSSSRASSSSRSMSSSAASDSVSSHKEQIANILKKCMSGN